MRVFIDEPALFSQPEGFEGLEALFHWAGQGRHELVLGPTVELEETPFFREAREQRQQAWAELLRRTAAANMARDRTAAPGARPLGPHAQVGAARDGGEARYQLNPEELPGWASQPLVLVLENHSDLSLLRVAIWHSEDEPLAERLHTALEQRWLTDEPPGGASEVYKRIERARESERLFVVVDSDRERWPELHPAPVESWALPDKSHGAAHIAELARARGLPCWVWWRREAENYLPMSLIDQGALDLRPLDLARQRYRTLRRDVDARPDHLMVVDVQHAFAVAGVLGARTVKQWLAGLLDRYADGEGEPDAAARRELSLLLQELDEWL